MPRRVSVARLKSLASDGWSWAEIGAEVGLSAAVVESMLAAQAQRAARDAKPPRTPKPPKPPPPPDYRREASRELAAAREAVRAGHFTSAQAHAAAAQDALAALIAQLATPINPPPPRPA